jgi:hypothetical protein
MKNTIKCFIVYFNRLHLTEMRFNGGSFFMYFIGSSIPVNSFNTSVGLNTLTPNNCALIKSLILYFSPHDVGHQSMVRNSITATEHQMQQKLHLMFHIHP